MINVSKFVKEHIPLCVCTLGIAILGYLGYHAVSWIINKSQRTQKVDHIRQENIPAQPLSKPPSDLPKSLINRVSSLEISPNKITMGQGEYIVFHKLPNGEKKQLSPETFEEVYKILIQHSPGELINRGSEKVNEECANRYELLKAKLKEIDSTLEAVFIPRTLYELIFIKKCIKEDIKHKGVCPSLDPFSHFATLEHFEGNQQAYENF